MSEQRPEPRIRAMGILSLIAVGIGFALVIFLGACISWFPVYRKYLTFGEFACLFWTGVILLVNSRVICYGIEYLGRRYQSFEKDKENKETRKVLEDYIQAAKDNKESLQKAQAETPSSSFNGESRTTNTVSSSSPRSTWGQRNR